jgi:hypothetical protein
MAMSTISAVRSISNCNAVQLTELCFRSLKIRASEKMNIIALKEMNKTWRANDLNDVTWQLAICTSKFSLSFR